MKDWWILFVVMTILAWGCYVPTIHMGQGYLGGPRPGGGGFMYSAGSLRAFFCVGLAYCLTAVVVPLFLFWQGMETTKFFGEGTSKGTYIAFLAGIFGAVGALGIVLAIKSGGKPIIVAPLVFAGAPIVNVLVAMMLNPPAKAPSPMFYIGILMAAVGAGIALYSRPEDKKPAITAPPATTVESPSTDLSTGGDTATTP